MDDSLYWNINTNSKTETNLFISPFILKKLDDILQVGLFDYQYINSFKVANIREHAAKSSERSISTLNIRLDKEVFHIDYENPSLLSVLGDIGGCQELLIMFGGIFVSFYSEKLFIAKMIK